MAEKLKVPSPGERLKASVVGFFCFRRKAAAGKLFACQVVLYAIAAYTSLAAACIGAGAVLLIGFFLTFHFSTFHVIIFCLSLFPYPFKEILPVLEASLQIACLIFFP
jgi:hypothetical protein